MLLVKYVHLLQKNSGNLEKNFKALEFNFDSSDKNHLVQKLS